MITIETIKQAGMTPENARLIGFIIKNRCSMMCIEFDMDTEFSQLCTDALRSICEEADKRET